MGEHASGCCCHEDVSIMHREEEENKDSIVLPVIGVVLFAGGMVIDIFNLGRYFVAPMDVFLSTAIFIAAYLLLGGGIIISAAKSIVHGKVFNENFLMSVATIGAFAIGESAEAVGVMLFFRVGEYFQESAVRKSKRSIAQLMDIRPDYANLKTPEGLVRVAPHEVGVGDMIVVKPGERVPMDGVVVEGESFLDTSALTGESVPRRASASDEVLSGSVNQSGALTIRVTQTFDKSTAARIIELVESAASKKAPTESFITKFARYYTPAVVGLALLIGIIPPLVLGGGWADWVNRGLIFLVISCPCALVISIPLSYFGGIGGASRKGILVKGGNYLEALSKLDTVVFDKTGTLTEGVFRVNEIAPAAGFEAEDLLEAAAIAEAFSNHPIAASITEAYGREPDREALTDYREIPGRGVSVKAGNKVILAGNRKLMAENNVDAEESGGVGTEVYVAVGGAFAGRISISDVIKEDSYGAVAALKARGVKKVIMLTGDAPEIAKAVADELNLDEYRGGLLPHEKVRETEALLEQGRHGGGLAFAGDGINDAPVLALADVGVAMGGLGQDAAIEAADVVIMTDEPSKLAAAIDIARFTKRIVWQNIIFALGVKAAFLTLGAFGLATMWEAVFADVGLALIAVLNAMRALRYAG